MALENIYPTSTPESLAQTVQTSEQFDLNQQLANEQSLLSREKLELQKKQTQDEMTRFEMRQEQERYMNEDNQIFQEEMAKVASELRKDEFKDATGFKTKMEAKLDHLNQKNITRYWKSFIRPFKERQQNLEEFKNIVQNMTKVTTLKIENAYKALFENSRAIARNYTVQALSADNFLEAVLNPGTHWYQPTGKKNFSAATAKDANNILKSMVQTQVAGADSLRPDNSVSFTPMLQEVTDLLSKATTDGLSADQEERLNKLISTNNGGDGQRILHILEDLNTTISSDAYRTDNILTTFKNAGFAEDEFNLREFQKGIGKIRKHLSSVYTEAKLRFQDKIPPSPESAALEQTGLIQALLQDVIEENRGTPLSESEIQDKFYEIVDMLGENMSPDIKNKFENSMMPYANMLIKNVTNRQDLGITSDQDEEFLKATGDFYEDFYQDLEG